MADNTADWLLRFGIDYDPALAETRDFARKYARAISDLGRLGFTQEGLGGFAARGGRGPQQVRGMAAALSTGAVRALQEGILDPTAGRDMAAAVQLVVNELRAFADGMARGGRVATQNVGEFARVMRDAAAINRRASRVDAAARDRLARGFQESAGLLLPAEEARRRDAERAAAEAQAAEAAQAEAVQRELGAEAARRNAAVQREMVDINDRIQKAGVKEARAAERAAKDAQAVADARLERANTGITRFMRNQAGTAQKAADKAAQAAAKQQAADEAATAAMEAHAEAERILADASENRRLLFLRHERLRQAADDAELRARGLARTAEGDVIAPTAADQANAERLAAQERDAHAELNTALNQEQLARERVTLALAKDQQAQLELNSAKNQYNAGLRRALRALETELAAGAPLAQLGDVNLAALIQATQARAAAAGVDISEIDFGQLTNRQYQEMQKELAQVERINAQLAEQAGDQTALTGLIKERRRKEQELNAMQQRALSAELASISQRVFSAEERAGGGFDEADFAAMSDQQRAAVAARLRQLDENLRAGRSRLVTEEQDARVLRQILVADAALLQDKQVQARAVRDSRELAVRQAIRDRQGSFLQRAQAAMSLTGRGPGGGGPRLPTEFPGMASFFGRGALAGLQYGVPSMLLYRGIPALAESIREAEELEIQLRLIARQLEDVGRSDSFAEIEDQVLSLARETGIASDELAKVALTFSGAFGPDIEAGVRVFDDELRAAAELALITGLSLDELKDSVVGVSLAFSEGVDTTTVRELGDMATALSVQFGVAVPEITSFLGDVGTSAAAVGFSLEEIGIIGAQALQLSGRGAAALAEAFGRVLPTMNQNKEAILDLARGTDRFDEVLRAIEAGDYGEVFLELVRIYGMANEAQQAQIVSLIGGRREAQALIPVLENSSRVLEAVGSGLDSTGALAERFGDASERLDVRARALVEGFNQFIRVLLDTGVAPALTAVLDIVDGGINTFRGFFELLGRINDLAGGYPGRFLAIVAVFRIVMFAVNTLRTAVETLNLAMQRLAATSQTATAAAAQAAAANAAAAAGAAGAGTAAAAAGATRMATLRAGAGAVGRVALGAAGGPWGLAIAGATLAYTWLSDRQRQLDEQIAKEVTEFWETQQTDTVEGVVAGLERAMEEEKREPNWVDELAEGEFGAAAGLSLVGKGLRALGAGAEPNEAEIAESAETLLNQAADAEREQFKQELAAAFPLFFEARGDAREKLATGLFIAFDEVLLKDRALAEELFVLLAQEVALGVISAEEARAFSIGLPGLHAGEETRVLNQLDADQREAYAEIKASIADDERSGEQRRSDFVNVIERIRGGPLGEAFLDEILPSLTSDPVLLEFVDKAYAEKQRIQEQQMSVAERRVATEQRISLGLAAPVDLVPVMQEELRVLRQELRIAEGAAEEAEKREEIAKKEQEIREATDAAFAQEVEAELRILELTSQRPSALVVIRKKINTLLRSLSEATSVAERAGITEQLVDLWVDELNTQAQDLLDAGDFEALEKLAEEGARIRQNILLVMDARTGELLAFRVTDAESLTQLVDAFLSGAVNITVAEFTAFLDQLVGIRTITQAQADAAQRRIEAGQDRFVTTMPGFPRVELPPPGAVFPDEVIESFIPEITGEEIEEAKARDAEEKAQEAARLREEANRRAMAQLQADFDLRKAMAEARGDTLEVARLDVEYARAVEALLQQQGAEQAEITNARATVIRAETALAEAEREAARAKMDDLEARYQLLIAQKERALGSDAAVDVAQLELELAQQQLEILRTTGASGAELESQQAAVLNVERAVKDAIFQQRLQELDFLVEMGELDNEAYIAELEALLASGTLRADQVREVRRKLKALREDVGRELAVNLPSFALPTLYEARRASMQADVGAFAPGRGGYQDQRVTTINLYASNAVDGEAAVMYIANSVGGATRIGGRIGRY